MKIFSLLLSSSISCLSFAQHADSSTQTLDPVIIKAFEQNRKLKDVAAAVNYIGSTQLQQFSTYSVVNAVNTAPGVRLEERSPGSYRFNVRGSSLRSPFGVRNVKIYFNDIPITDPSGNTYFNNLGFYNIASIEIVKGPGSSLYGAGTGGVAIIESVSANDRDAFTTQYTAGSYNSHNIFTSATLGDNDSKNKISFQHQQSNGFRHHSALRRNIFSWSGRLRTGEKGNLKTTFLYSDLFYQTPGALTSLEYNQNSKAARPAGGGFPGAEQAKASIQQKTFIGGLSYTHSFSETFINTTTAYGMFTELRNPAIRNYGKNEEPHTGGRTSFTYKKNFGTNRLQLSAGAELQQGFFSVGVYKNRAGQPDTLQTLDEIRLRQGLAFFQASYQVKNWELTASGSLNFLKLQFKRSTPLPLPQQQRRFSNELAPRIALSKSWSWITVYASLAKGFSPPTAGELLPSGSAINLSLQAERGLNRELGARGNIKTVHFDINVFSFSLQNTIVQRRDAGGGEYFINAGSTSQRGIETILSYPVLKKVSLLRTGRLWVSHTFHRFRYKDFKQLNTDFSGKVLPGIAPHTMAGGIDVLFRNRLSANINYNYSSAIFLNDANSDKAHAYHLIHLKIGQLFTIKQKWELGISAGVENLLNQRYSLGNDINGFGGRYYNAAPGRNIYLTLTSRILAK